LRILLEKKEIFVMKQLYIEIYCKLLAPRYALLLRFSHRLLFNVSRKLTSIIHYNEISTMTLSHYHNYDSY